MSAARLLNSIKERERLNTKRFIENQSKIMHEYRTWIENMTMNVRNESRRQHKDALKTHMQDIQIWIASETKFLQFLQDQRDYFQQQLQSFTSALEAHTLYLQSLNNQLQKLQQDYNNL